MHQSGNTSRVRGRVVATVKMDLYLSYLPCLMLQTVSNKGMSLGMKGSLVIGRISGCQDCGKFAVETTISMPT